MMPFAPRSDSGFEPDLFIQLNPDQQQFLKNTLLQIMHLKRFYLKRFERGICRNLWMAGEFAPEVVSCNNVPGAKAVII
jgi:hypothetical protein